MFKADDKEEVKMQDSNSVWQCGGCGKSAHFGACNVARPHKCPVCEGKRTMPYGFYHTIDLRDSLDATSADTVVYCRTCDAKGFIVLC